MKKGFSLVIGLPVGLALSLAWLPNAGAYPLASAAMVNADIALQGRNIISGTVFGDTHRPVPDVYVELLDDFNSSINRARTDGSGRFTFGGLPDGRYRVHVLTYGTDYLEQTQEVILSSISTVTGGSGSDRQNVDFALRINERLLAGPFAVSPLGVLFVQEVPASAKALYGEGVKNLREKKEKEGFESLKKAIEIFPDYYMALDRLGAEYAIRGTTDRSYLEAGFVLLTRAVEVNPHSVSSVFGLGWTQYQLGLNNEAIATLKSATTLYSKAVDPYLWLGKALKRGSTPAQAEAAFKQANDLSKGKVAEVHWQLAGLYNDQKRYKEAADEFELYLKTEPKAADADKIKALIKQLREKGN